MLGGQIASSALASKLECKFGQLVCGHSFHFVIYNNYNAVNFDIFL